MRTITAALDTAQRQASRDPVIAAAVRNDVECVRRLDFTRLNSTSQTAAKHDVVSDAGTVHRVRMSAGTVKYNRVLAADVGTPANFDSYSDLITGIGSQVAISARGSRVLVVYTNAIGTSIRYRESTDDGATFSADANFIAAAATVLDLACAYKDSAGDCAVFAARATTVVGCERVAGVIGGLLTDPFAYGAVSTIAATFAFHYELLITGTEATTLKPTVWSGTFLEASDTWETPLPQIQADSGLTTFAAPFLTFLDTWRANFTELPLYSGGITRAWRTYLHPAETWNARAFLLRTQLPTDHHLTVGLALAANSTAGYVYESSTDGVWQAPTALVSLDIAADILALELHESTLDGHGWVDLVNPDDPTARRYAIPPPAPIKLGNMVRFGFGYRTNDDSYSGLILRDDPVAYYRLGEAAGQPQDSSGNANHTTVTGGTPTYSQAGAISGDADTAIRFDSGSSEYFTAPDSATLDVGDVFSIECWVKRLSIGGAFPQYIVSKELAAYELRFNTNNTISLLAGGNVVAISHVTNGDVADTTTWHHIVATKNGADLHIYLDGVDVTDTVENHTATNNTTPLNIARTNNNEFHLNATLDELAIYNTALSASQVAEHFTQTGGAGGLAETSPVQDFWITAIEHRRSMRGPGGRAVLRLHLEGAFRRLRRCLQRASVTHTADDYRQILSAILSRAGVSLSVTNASSRSDATIPRLTIDPDASAHQAMSRALAFLQDRIFMGRSSTAHMKELLVSGETGDYAVADQYPDDPGYHPIFALRLNVTSPPTSEVWVSSLTAALAYMTGISVDQESGPFGLAPVTRIRDLSSDATSEADATADAHIVQRRFDRDDGTLTCPPIVNLELLDVLDLGDPYAATDLTLKRRVSAITWRYKRQASSDVYEQAIALCPATDQDGGTGGIE